MTKSYFWTFLCERLCPLAQCDKWERQRKLSRQKKSRADLSKMKILPSRGVSSVLLYTVDLFPITTRADSTKIGTWRIQILQTWTSNFTLKWYTEMIWGHMRLQVLLNTTLGMTCLGVIYHIKKDSWSLDDQQPEPPSPQKKWPL